MKRATFLVALCLFAACKKGGDAPASSVTPAAKLISDLSVFATGRLPDADDVAAREKELNAGTLKLEAYVADLLKKPMSGRLAKDLVVSASTSIKDRHPIPASYTLSTLHDGGKTIYYLAKKCGASDAVSVKPWWDTKEVLVCPEAYRPDVKGDTSGRTCGGSMLAPRDIDLCGCGPGLMFCTESNKHYDRMQDRVQQEIVDTTAYVVENNLPIEQLFTMNETVRTDDAEFLYRRARVLAGEDPSLLWVDDLGDKGKLAPRVEQMPGQQAGILSSPALTYSSDALRGVLRNYYDYLWCSGLASSRVTTDAVLNLGTVDLRVGDGWKKLAGLNICTDCHARLDYGMQFFWAYPNSTQGIDFRPSMMLKGTGPLYGRNIHDARGSGELTPQGFAKLATAQPEFGDCMTRKVVDHVFNGTNTLKDFSAVRDSFDETHKIKEMLKVAMTRYANREWKRAKEAPVALAAAPAAPAAPAAASDEIALSAPLQALIKRDCKECHDVDDDIVLMKPTLSKQMVETMLDKVAFGQMPKNAEGLDDDERRAFVSELAAHLFADAGARDAAIAYFGDGMRGQPVHRFASAMQSVISTAGPNLHGFRPNAIETAVAQSSMTYSPGMAMSAAVTALRSCREAGKQGPDLADCVERSTAPDVVIAGPPRAPQASAP